MEVWCQHPSVLEVLLEARADANTRAPGGDTTLHITTEAGPKAVSLRLI
jgi:hypothetical protein